MYTPETSKHFTAWQDPVSGVTSYILTTRVAPAQKCFYFVNPCMSADGRYFWFEVMYPPCEYKTLCVLDFETDEISAFPTSTGHTCEPLVTPEGDCLYTNTQGIYRQSPDPKAEPVKICGVPKQVRVGNHKVSLATHLTFTADGRELFLDSRTGGDRAFHIGTVNVETGEYTLWFQPDHIRNHGQANPVFNDLILFAEDHTTDYQTGAATPIRCDENGDYMRLWYMRRGDKQPTMIPPLGNYATHEWWSSDGKWVFYCNCGVDGVCGYNVFTGEHKLIYHCQPWHSHSTFGETAFVNDEVLHEPPYGNIWYRGCPSKVVFYNAATGKYADIVSRNPPYNTPDDPNIYHMDPHPRFNASDRYITSTTTVRDGVMDVLITPTAQLFELTK